MLVGLVGCGRIGQVHAATLATHPLVTGIEIVDPRGLPPAMAAGPGRLVGAVDAAASRWAAAVVATPTADHDAVVRTLLGRGIPTFCEKPITLDPTTTSELGRMAGDAGRCRGGVDRRNSLLL